MQNLTGIVMSGQSVHCLGDGSLPLLLALQAHTRDLTRIEEHPEWCRERCSKVSRRNEPMNVAHAQVQQTRDLSRPQKFDLRHVYSSP